MCDGNSTAMMISTMPILVLALTTAFAAPAAIYNDNIEQVPQKRAALVLDRLLIALQKALHEEGNTTPYDGSERDGPRTAPLRIPAEEVADMVRHRPQKRPALVIDQLLMAIQRALNQDSEETIVPSDLEEPRVAPVRIAYEELPDMSSLERRGQTNPGRGRVLRCYFNAVTCF